MNRGFALTIGFLAVLAPAMAHAQTNIDQGKSASQIVRQCLRGMPQGAARAGEGKERGDRRGVPARALHDRSRPSGRARGLRCIRPRYGGLAGARPEAVPLRHRPKSRRRRTQPPMPNRTGRVTSRLPADR